MHNFLDWLTADWNFFWTWVGSTSSLLGFGATVFVAVFAYRLQRRDDRVKANQAKVERRKQLIAILRYFINLNQSFVKNCLVEIETRPTSSRPDLAVLDATAALKYELIDDFQFCKNIDAVRNFLTDISRTLEILAKVDYDGTMRVLMNFQDGTTGCLRDQLRPNLVLSIKQISQQCLAACEKVLADWPKEQV